MLRIALCDDSPTDLKITADYLAIYLQKNDLSAEVQLFTHPDALLNAGCAQPFHLYFLDVVMPMLSGIELGVALRERDNFAQIVYITTSPEYALESFAAQPLGYLIKPMTQAAFEHIAALALSKISCTEPIIYIKTRENVFSVPVFSIQYCEYVNHTVVYTLKSGETLHTLSSRQPFFETVQPLLQNRCFLRTHASYVCNLRYVQRLTNTAFCMEDGTSIPISKKLYPSVRDFYMDYALGVSTALQ